MRARGECVQGTKAGGSEESPQTRGPLGRTLTAEYQRGGFQAEVHSVRRGVKQHGVLEEQRLFQCNWESLKEVNHSLSQKGNGIEARFVISSLCATLGKLPDLYELVSSFTKFILRVIVKIK